MARLLTSPAPWPGVAPSWLPGAPPSPQGNRDVATSCSCPPQPPTPSAPDPKPTHLGPPAQLWGSGTGTHSTALLPRQLLPFVKQLINQLPASIPAPAAPPRVGAAPRDPQPFSPPPGRRQRGGVRGIYFCTHVYTQRSPSVLSCPCSVCPGQSPPPLPSPQFPCSTGWRRAMGLR